MKVSGKRKGEQRDIKERKNKLPTRRSADKQGGGRSNTPEEVAAPPADLPESPPVDDQSLNVRTRKSDLRPRTPRQRDYLNQILRHDITFGIGPAGTGKT